MKVYKFHPDNEFLVAVLRDKETWHSKLAYLNDPFECTFIDKTGSPVYQQLVKTFCVCCYSETFKEILMWSHYAVNHSGVCLEFEIDDETLKTTFIKIEYSNSLTELTEVRTHQVPGENFGTLDINIATNGRFIRTKFETWSYERERRTILIREDPNIRGVTHPFFGTLTGIYYGVNCSDEAIARIKVASTQIPNVSHKKVVLNTTGMFMIEGPAV